MIVSMDIETTGLNPDTCQILEIGAFCDMGQFHCYVDNGLIQGEPYALHTNRCLLKKIVDCPNYLLLPHKIAPAFAKWLAAVSNQKVTIAGENFASFDKMFLDQLPGWRETINCHFQIIDVGNLYWQPDIDGDTLPGLKTCMYRAGMIGDVPHTALEDAKIVHNLVEAKKNEL